MKRMMNEQTLEKVSHWSPEGVICGGSAYRHITLNRMTQWKLKMLAIPSAKHSIMQIMPALKYHVNMGPRSISNLRIAHTIGRIYLRKSIVSMFLRTPCVYPVLTEVSRSELLCERHVVVMLWQVNAFDMRNGWIGLIIAQLCC